MLLTQEGYDDAALTALIAAATLLGADLKAGLFTNSPVLSKQMDIADLTEPTYAGYVRKAVVQGAPYRDPNLGICSVAAVLNWSMADALVPTIVNGIFYVSGAGPYLVAVELFSVPQPLTDALSSFGTLLRYVQSPPASSSTTVIN